MPGAARSFLQQNAHLSALIYQVKSAQAAARFFRRMQQTTVVDRELVLVQGTLNDAAVDAGDIQRMCSMRACRLDQEQFPGALQQ